MQKRHQEADFSLEIYISSSLLIEGAGIRYDIVEVTDYRFFV